MILNRAQKYLFSIIWVVWLFIVVASLAWHWVVIGSLPVLIVHGVIGALGLLCLCLVRIERRRLADELKRERTRLQAFWGVADLADADTKTVSDHILNAITTMTGSQYGFYGFVSPDESTMTIYSWTGGAMEDCSMAHKPTEFAIDKAGLWGEAVRRREPFICDDYSREHPGKKGLPKGHVPISSLLAVPFYSGERITAVAAVANRATPYSQDDVIQIQSFLTSIDSIVRSKRAEDALRQSEERYQTVADFSHDWEIWTAPDGQIIYCSKSVMRLTGYSAEELQADPSLLVTMVHPDDRAQAKSHFDNECLDDQHDYHLDFRIITKEGEERWFSHWCVPVKDDRKGFLGRRGSIRDISQRVKAQEEKGKLAAAIEQVDEAVVICDCEGIIQYVNPAFERMTGYTRAEVEGQNPRILKSGEHDEAFYESLWETLLKGETWHGRFVNRKKDGTLYRENATISPVRDANGKTICYVAVKRDVTRELEVEERLRQAQKMEALGTLAGGIAHDFNNILFSLNGFAEILRQDLAKTAPDAVPLVEHILTAGTRASQLVKQILAFGRKSQERRLPVSLGALVTDAVQMLRQAIPSSVQIRLVVGDAPDLVVADSVQMHQVVVNLCTNAWQAMRGTAEPQIDVCVSEYRLGEDTEPAFSGLKPGVYVQLSVSDRGSGVSIEHLDRIFDPFFTTKPPGEGTGLGLSVVHGVVQNHGGAIAVRSQLGKGTTFDILLPRFQGETEPSSVKSSKAQLPHGTERILVVDDENSILVLSSRVLVSLGYHVTTRLGGPAGLETFMASPDSFDLVITDMTMPELTGLQLATRIGDVRPDMKMILCTGYGDETEDKNYMEYGFDEILFKPVPVGELAEGIRRVLDSSIEYRGH